MPIRTETIESGSAKPRDETGLRQRLADHEQKIFDIFTLSFRFSQGVPGGQAQIFQFLSAKGYLDGLVIPEKTPDYAYDVPVPKTHSEKARTRVDNEGDINTAWAYFHIAKENKAHLNHAENLPYILHGMLKQDIKFQDKERPGKSIPEGKTVKPDSNEDPHASFTRKYVISKHTTGHDAFNDMFEEIHAFMKDPDALASFQTLSEEPSDVPVVVHPLPRAIQELRTKWEEKHPDYSFFPEAIAA